jgi:hypothetical protein
VRTKHNTAFRKWWKQARKEFAQRGLTPPLLDETQDAYELGEDPREWAEFLYPLEVQQDARDFERRVA